MIYRFSVAQARSCFVTYPTAVLHYKIAVCYRMGIGQNSLGPRASVVAGEQLNGIVRVLA